jgi:predicted phage tail protein
MASIRGSLGRRQREPRKPRTAPDTLHSKQYAQLVDLLSEGEIGGLVNGAQSIFLDNTPLQNADGSYNFQDVIYQERTGTQIQSAVEIYGDAGNIEDEHPVNVEVTQAGGAIVRTITDTTVEAVRITITVPAIYIITDKGDVGAEDAHVVIDRRYTGGGWIQQYSDTNGGLIRGRSNDAYQRDFIVPIAGGTFPVDIRVSRGNPDSTSEKKVNDFIWTSYTEIIYAKFNYANSAYIALRCNSEAFSAIPQRSYLINGIKVAIPSNATVDPATGRLIYAGVWNGLFGAAQWTTDPAMILWDLLTDTRYGFGDHIQAADLDKWAFYAASQYSSALVSDGRGGLEPRFSCNVNIQTAEDAYKLIGDMCSVFRAMPYWGAGALTVSQDAPSDPTYLFTPANVKDGIFNYTGSSLKNRPTVAVVSYMDLTLRDIVKEVVEDQALIAKYGVTTTEISAFACTSRSQAHRMGRWMLYSEWSESEVVTFTVGIEAGVVVRPGQIISIADPVRAGARRGGRIASATTTAITADDTTGITYAAGATLSVILPTGVAQTRAVTSIAGKVFNVSPAFTTAPNANSVWVYETTAIQSQLFRVLGIEEQDGIEYNISALEHNPSKYAYIESGLALADRDITDLNKIPPPPANLSAQEVLYEGAGGVKSKIIVSWAAVVTASQYTVRYRVDNRNWITSTQAVGDYEILDNIVGTYEIEVYSLNAALQPSTLPATLTFNAFGKTAPPANVSGLSLVAIDNASAILSWNRATDIDVLVGGKVLIRHSQALTGAEWDASQEIVAAAAGSQTQKLVPLLDGTYLVKFEDDTGNRSLTPTLVLADLPTPQPRLLVQTYAEDLEAPPFSGNYTDMAYQIDLGGLTLASGTAVDDMATDGNWDALPSIDGIGGIVPAGSYEFGSSWDMGAVFDVNLQRRLRAFPYLPNGLWDDRVGLVDDWPAIDEDNLDQTDARVYVRSTIDNPSGTPTWSDWREFANAIVRGRGFQFKLRATTSNPDLNLIVSELGAVLELQQRIEQSAVLTSGAVSYGVVFGAAFYQTPAVGITAMNMQTGDYYAITATTRQGFTIVFRDSAGAAVSRQFTYSAVGYGKEI